MRQKFEISGFENIFWSDWNYQGPHKTRNFSLPHNSIPKSIKLKSDLPLWMWYRQTTRTWQKVNFRRQVDKYTNSHFPKTSRQIYKYTNMKLVTPSSIGIWNELHWTRMTGWTEAKGTQRFFPSFLVKGTLRRFYPYNFVFQNFEIFLKS
jgi:hypothetical protein